MPKRSEYVVTAAMINDPGNPDRTEVKELKYIGDLIQGKLAMENIVFLQDYLDYIEAHTQAQNKALFQRILESERWVNGDRCVGRPDAQGNVYAVRRYNFRAWQALVFYARQHLHGRRRYRRMRRADGTVVRQDRIPALLPVRAPDQAFPVECEV